VRNAPGVATPGVAKPRVATPGVAMPFVLGLALALSACVSTRGVSTPGVATPVPKSAGPGRSATGSLQDPGTQIVDNAMALLGERYRYGGASPGGFDCSGLVEYAAGIAGIHLPRTASEQAHAGTRIAKRDLRAGDLVFMHLARKELHVGIAIDGDRFVHAPSSGGRVRVDSLSSPPYARGFIQARRIVVDAPTH
jgi:cell wall-associated NlpC family hydrolase